MKALFVADIHLGLNLYNKAELTADVSQAFVDSVQFAITNSYTHYAIAGDLFDTNKPNAATLVLVQDQVSRLLDAGIQVVGITGDHDKPINDASWMQACGIPSKSRDGKIVGANYNDEPESVLNQLREELTEKTEVILLHGHVPELWKFTEEKKTLRLTQELKLFEYLNLQGIVLGDIHIPKEGKLFMPETKKDLFIGYCGSLGVTRVDEGTKPGYLTWENGFSRKPYLLPRFVVEHEVTSIGFNLLNEQLKKNPKPDVLPFIVLRYTKETAQYLNKYAEKITAGIVKTVPAAAETREEKQIVRTDNPVLNTAAAVAVLELSEASEILLLSLLEEAADTKGILDRFIKSDPRIKNADNT